MQIAKFFAWLKFRFDLGSVALTFINFIMLVIMVSDKVVTYFNIQIAHAQMVIVLVSIPLGFLVMLAIGQILIKVKYFEHYNNEANQRNPIYDELIAEIRSLKK